ncbi:MAG TPA: site-specific integrase [Acidimicrobiales bacterium]|nr:site-specific integrase [Acidimicrobiales bacterium]
MEHLSGGTTGCSLLGGHRGKQPPTTWRSWTNGAEESGMAVKKLANGRWEASYRDPQRRERTKTFATRREADRWLVSVKTDVARGHYVDPRLARSYFRDWAEEWMATTAHLKPKTRTGYDSDLRIHVLPVFGDMAVGSIQQIDVRRFVADMVATGAAPGTVRNARKVLRLVLATAEGSGAVRGNPCNGVRVPMSPKADMVVLDAEGVELLARAIDPRYSTLVRFAAYTGLRAGEIGALRVGRLDLLRGRVLVAEAVTDVDRMGLVFGEPKTYQRRSVTLPAFLRDDLAAHLAGRRPKPEDFVFQSPTGKVLHHKTFYRRFFKPAVAAAGLPPAMRFHDLRHTCAALCIALGAHPKAIQERLGHSSITVTLDRYGHLFPKLDEALTQRLDTLHQAAADQGTATPLARATGALPPPSLGAAG